VGNGGMTDDEYRAHFSLWAIMAAPLMAGNDVRALSPATRDILTNPDVIAVDQDSLGVQGMLVREGPPELQVWAKPLKGGARALALLNRGDSRPRSPRGSTGSACAPTQRRCATYGRGQIEVRSGASTPRRCRRTAWPWCG